MKLKISRSIRLTLLLLLIVLSSVAPASAQESDQALVVGTISSGGLPVGGLEIIVNMAMGETYIPITNTTTDSEGRFEVFEDLFGNLFLLEFNYSGLAHVEAFASGNVTHTLDLDLSGSLDFKILSIDGAGVEGIEVSIMNKIGYTVGDTETDSTGSGRFEGINIEDPFMLMFDYDGVPYSQVFDFINETAASVELQLLETTTSDEDIEADMHHVIVEMEGEYLSVWEGITFLN